MDLTALWKEITPHPLSSIKQATEQYHHAIQYIAMCGKSYLEEQPDDSQTNLEWWPDRNCFAGRRIPAKPSFRLVLDTENFCLVFYRDARHKGEFLSLNGLKKEEVLEWIQEIVQRKGLALEKLTAIKHYQIPDYSLDAGQSYTQPSPSAQNILAIYRSNADLVLANLSSQFSHASSVRIWPHHFDTGIYVPLVKNEEGEVSHSLVMGLAIPDAYVSDYYFYVNPWREEGTEAGSELPQISGEGVWNTKDWVGTVLPMSKIGGNSSISEQVQQVESFFQSAIHASINLLGLDADSFLP